MIQASCTLLNRAVPRPLPSCRKFVRNPMACIFPSNERFPLAAHHSSSTSIPLPNTSSCLAPCSRIPARALIPASASSLPNGCLIRLSPCAFFDVPQFRIPVSFIYVVRKTRTLGAQAPGASNPRGYAVLFFSFHSLVQADPAAFPQDRDPGHRKRGDFAAVDG